MEIKRIKQVAIQMFKIINDLNPAFIKKTFLQLSKIDLDYGHMAYCKKPQHFNLCPQKS